MYVIGPVRLVRGAWKAWRAARRGAAARAGKAGIENMTEAQAAEITKEEFERYSPAIRAKLLLKFRNDFEFVNMSNLERILFALTTDDEAAVLKMSESDAAEIPKEEFEKLLENTRAKLLERFRDTFEYVGSLERTLFILRVDGEAAIPFLSEEDAAEIPKKEFNELLEMTRVKLLEKFRAFGFDNLERTMTYLKLDVDSAVDIRMIYSAVDLVPRCPKDHRMPFVVVSSSRNCDGCGKSRLGLGKPVHNCGQGCNYNLCEDCGKKTLTAVRQMSEGDAEEIPKEEFEKLPEP
ncbi:hypothetical protein TrLO_g4736 [Triparma laevis f. longispina]|uniref:Uncharacterized protein n=1 Tax=Triparma laevis f. longispina TaxID=1714387 RepID=A0A9W7FB88_9STRA|nr:hypothetical protein TrLO_g4736 [Triparma laevis f. longispina]